MGEKSSTYHNHHTFMEQLFRNEHPKDVVQKGTTKKNCTHLIHKTLKLLSEEQSFASQGYHCNIDLEPFHL